MAGRSKESWTVGLRTPHSGLSLLVLMVLSAAYALLAFGRSPDLPATPVLPSGSLWTAFFLFLIPGVLGSALATPLATVVEGKLTMRRALFTGVLMYGLVGVGLLFWTMFVLLHGYYPIEGVLLALFGLAVWWRQMLISGISGPTPTRAIPASLVTPLLGMITVWAVLGINFTYVVEGVLFLLVPLGTTFLLIYAANAPMKREFGEGGVTILRPIIDHINERDPEASRKLEEFFSTSSTEADLALSVLSLRDTKGKGVVWVVPTVHPGPFAELGSSDLPHKISTMLSLTTPEVVVPHTPCTHDQNIPTTEEVRRVAGAAEGLLSSIAVAPARASPLVEPYAGSMARAQVVGDAVLLLITLAPEPSDDVDYSVGEMIRAEAHKLGYQHPIVIDAHNSYVAENMGTVPFGSPQGFKLVEDARAAMIAAGKAVKEGPVRAGFSRRRDLTPKKDGLGKEGIAVTVIEGGGRRTAYVLLDGNNLLKGMRAKILTAVKGKVDDGEVMTTDNHVVHEVADGVNPIGLRRTVEELAGDVEDLLTRALADLAPVEVASGSTRVPKVKVMGHGMTVRLMTALNDSFSAFWALFPTTLLITVLAELLVLSLLP